MADFFYDKSAITVTLCHYGTQVRVSLSRLARILFFKKASLTTENERVIIK